MTDLELQLKAIKADSLPSLVALSKAWDLFCQAHSRLFEKARQNKPESPVSSHLLGILTKAHVEASSYVQSNAASMQAMHQAFHDNLGQDHAGKFEEQGMDQLILCTHLWLYVQGYLRLDFSLANDHAQNSAELISSVNKLDVQSLRTEFLSSYYHGSERSPIQASGSFTPITWLKKLFS